MDRSIRLAECLADTLPRIDRQAWPRVIDRVRETMELTGFDGSLTLAGQTLVLTAAEQRHIIGIGCAA